VIRRRCLSLLEGDEKELVERIEKRFLPDLQNFLKSLKKCWLLTGRVFQHCPLTNEQIFEDDMRWLEFLSVLRKNIPVERYYLKAMNCPHHHRIFAAEPRSYRDLPLRLAEYGTCYRYAQSGELFGLHARPLAQHERRAHLCTPEQFAAEFNAVTRCISSISDFRHREVSDCGQHLVAGRSGQKIRQRTRLWKQPNMVRQFWAIRRYNYVEVANEAAFYGPKIDVQVWSVIGRDFTLATNQVDFGRARAFRLGLSRQGPTTDKTPLCIHRAPLGTHDGSSDF